jgi:hypothetical protein
MTVEATFCRPKDPSRCHTLRLLALNFLSAVVLAAIIVHGGGAVNLSHAITLTE